MSFLLFCALATACGKHESAFSTATVPASTQPAPTATTSGGIVSVPPSFNADDLAGISNGAMLVKAPSAEESGNGAYRVIDEDPLSHWVSNDGQGTNQVFVIQLAERSTIDKIELDTAEAGLDTHTPKQLTVEMSDGTADGPYKPLANVTLQAMKDGQTFSADGNVPGRFIRLTVVTNYGGPITELSEFRAFGKRLTNTPLPNITGLWKIDEMGGDVRLKQVGTSVTGCFRESTINGGIEGHVLKFRYDTTDDKGPALLAFSTDGKHVFGGYWKESQVEEHPHMFAFEGSKVSDDPGQCPGQKKPEQLMESALQDEKRLRLYGINFDSDSDRLRDESKPALDLVAGILQAHAGWKITIEGHTDSTSTPEHNQQLSEARANAVKTYLTGKGIDAARLSTSGLGATKPVATNDTALGRAANRRVELVRM